MTLFSGNLVVLTAKLPKDDKKAPNDGVKTHNDDAKAPNILKVKCILRQLF